jgi:putative addiction module killer protein
MIIETTVEFDDWLRRLKDRQARGRILERIARLRDRDQFGDVRSVGGSVREMRINTGPGYRIYFVQRGTTVVILLCGGDKGSQSNDIATAKTLAEGLD